MGAPIALNTVMVRTRPQTERATDSAICLQSIPSVSVPERAASRPTECIPYRSLAALDRNQ